MEGQNINWFFLINYLIASSATFLSSGQLSDASLVDCSVNGFPTLAYEFTDKTVGPTFV